MFVFLEKEVHALRLLYFLYPYLNALFSSSVIGLLILSRLIECLRKQIPANSGFNNM